ncbi:MAG: thioredoxin family protein [Anaerolineae bacterium]|nr:thioredoxin family protein [Anaerolineae bacterium]
MINIKVLGSGCANCKRLQANVERLAAQNNLPIELEKVTEYADILKWNIMATPGLVINDKVVSAGRIPTDTEIVRWLTASQN